MRSYAKSAKLAHRALAIAGHARADGTGMSASDLSGMIAGHAAAHASEGADLPTTLVNITAFTLLGMVAMGIGKMAMRELLRRDDGDQQTGCCR
jgi:hypothetical protein